MSVIRAANLVRCYFSGTCAASPGVTVVSLQGDPAGFVTAFVPTVYSVWGSAVPVQWEVKNDSSVPLNIAFSGLPAFALTAAAAAQLVVDAAALAGSLHHAEAPLRTRVRPKRRHLCWWQFCGHDSYVRSRHDGCWRVQRHR